MEGLVQADKDLKDRFPEYRGNRLHLPTSDNVHDSRDYLYLSNGNYSSGDYRHEFVD